VAPLSQTPAANGSAAAGPVLITGAAGFAGSFLLEQLRASHAARAAETPAAAPRLIGWHHPSSTPSPQPHGTASSPDEWQAVDLVDPSSVHAAIAACRPSAVYHLAGLAHQGKSWQHVHDTLRVNALGTHHLLDALRQAGDGDTRVLVIGSATVYRPSDEPMDEDAAIGPVSPYGVSKLAQEMVGLQAFTLQGQPVIVSRSFNHIGPRQTSDYVAASFARQIAEIERGLKPPMLSVGNLSPRRDLMDVRDTVRAYQALMEHGQAGRVYNVCAGEAHAVREILDGLIAMSGVSVDVQIDPARQRSVDQPLVQGRYDRLTRETGWRPEFSWNQTLSDLLDYWRQQVR
jgi:GDP-4-dehydro-6-deoxy-D-mannose reductase